MDIRDGVFLDGIVKDIYDIATDKPSNTSQPPTYEYKDFEERIEKAKTVPTPKKDNTLFYGAIAAGVALILATKV